MIKSICAGLLILCQTTFDFQKGFDYNNNKEFVEGVKNCAVSYNSFMHSQHRIPIEIIVSQAVLESDWGRSRFAIEGNNLYGMRQYDLTEPHIKPLKKPNANFGLKVYETKCLSVVDYIETILSHHGYTEFREKLYQMWAVDEYDIFLLTEMLYNYSADKKYAGKLRDTILYINERGYLYGRK